ncbi:MAG: PmoA family protein [Verrucomicrobia bacterium]|nr:PmoA family protein [Verrucomicrobiota bacterium]
MKTRALPLVVLAALLAPVSVLRAAANEVKLTRSPDRVRVEIGGKLFTEYCFKDVPRPFLYPVLAADGTEMTRNYPMKKGVPGEVEDHPHHRSLWFTHGDVNGIDFWAEGSDKKGKIVSESVDASSQGGTGVVKARNKWVGPDGTVHLTDETTIRFHGTADARFIDYEVTLKAPAGKPVIFGDTKEGSMAIRLPLWMTPSHSQGRGKKHEGKGTIINAEGITNDATWGKKSTWVDYHAPKDGKVYGVAMFDHPKNPRHPTWWHVRTYALFAANPFGKHDFENLKNEPKAGEMTLPAGGSLTFRWRFYFHTGDEKAAKVAAQYAAYAAGK